MANISAGKQGAARKPGEDDSEERAHVNLRKVMAGGMLAAAIAGAGLSLGAGTANAAPDVVNRTFNDAKRMIQQAGGTAVIATRTGAALEDGKCLVMNAWDAGYQRIVRGGMRANNEVLLALNCNGGVAGPGSAGNSVASPEGQVAIAKAEAAAAERKRQRLEAAQAEKDRQERLAAATATG